MGNTFKDSDSRNLHKKLKPHHFSTEDLADTFSQRHAAFVKKKRTHYIDFEGVPHGYEKERKTRAAQDIRARRADRHLLNTHNEDAQISKNRLYPSKT